MNSANQGVQLIDYARAIKRRWPFVLMVTLLVVAAALTVSFASEKKYDASAELLFGGQESVQNLVTPDATVDSGDPERELNNNVQLIKLDTVAEAVKRRLRLDVSVEQLLEMVETETSATSDIVTVVVRDTDPRRAAAIANAYVEEYVAFRRRSSRQRYNSAARLADARLAALSPSELQSEEARQLRARKRELEITAALQTGGVEIVRRARAPEAASRPRPKLALAVGLVLGLLLGVALALALEFADRRLKDEDAVEDVFELPVVAAIPPPPRRGMDDHVQREAYGMLAANVRLSSTADSQVVMVTSPSPEDGKTSVSIGLARALARIGVRVILIEADLRRPSMARYTGVSQTGGLTALLEGRTAHLAHEITWLDANSMRPVTLDDLKEGLSFAVLTAGGVPSHPQRLLARPEMTATLETARSLADVVIVDTPPIGTVNDPMTLSRFVDSVVVVARLNKTTKDAARRALRSLRSLTQQVTGVVVTDAALGDQYGYYGHGESQVGDGRSALESIER